MEYQHIPRNPGSRCVLQYGNLHNLEWDKLNLWYSSGVYFRMIKNLGIVSDKVFFKGMPEAVADFGIEGLETAELGGHGGTAGGSLIGTAGFHLVKSFGLGNSTDIGLLDKAEGTDEGDGVVLKGELGLHGRCRAFKDEVHQEGREDVVLVMTQCNLVETIVLGEGEEGFTAVPGAEETAGLPGIGALVETAVENMKTNALFCTEVLEITPVAFIGDVVHNDMGGLYADSGFVDLRPGPEQTDELQGVLTPRKRNKDAVSVLEESEVRASFVEAFLYALCWHGAFFSGSFRSVRRFRCFQWSVPV